MVSCRVYGKRGHALRIAVGITALVLVRAGGAGLPSLSGIMQQAATLLHLELGMLQLRAAL